MNYDQNGLKNVKSYSLKLIFDSIYLNIQGDLKNLS